MRLGARFSVRASCSVDLWSVMDSGTGLRANRTADLPPDGRWIDARLLEE